MTFAGKFVLIFLSRTFSIHRSAKEGKRYLFNSSLPLPLPLQRHLAISRAVTVVSLTLHIASSQTQTGNLIYTYVILIYIYLHIYIYIYIYINLYIYIYNIYILWVLLTLLRKKENALIIHSAMETWKYAIIRNFIILSLCPSSTISHPLGSEPATPLKYVADSPKNNFNSIPCDKCGF